MKKNLWAKAIEATIESKEIYDGDFLDKAKNYSFTEYDIYKRLGNYKTLRNFRGKSKPNDLVSIKKFLLKYGHNQSVCPVEVVNSLIKLIIKEYGFVGTSAASKLLYPFFPEKVRIYDSYAIRALEKMGEKGIKYNYEFYLEAWNRQYRAHFPKISSELKKHSQKQGHIFQLRVFDKYLWLLGKNK